MINNKLIQLLNTFSKKEMTRFGEFVESPYFNKHIEVRNLIHYFERIFPKFTEKNCDRGVIAKQLLVTKKNNSNQLPIIFTYSLRLLEQFLVQENLKQNKFQQSVALLLELRKKQQNKHYLKKLESLESDLEKYPLRDKIYYKNKFLTAAESDSYYIQTSRSFDMDESLQRKQNFLELYFIAETLSDACEMLTRSAIVKTDYDSRFLESIIKELNTHLDDYNNAPAIIVYYKIYQMLSHQEDDYFQKAKIVVNKNERFFLKEELYKIYNYLVSYSIAQINNNKVNYLRELFELYKRLLEKELIFEKGQLSEWYYKNIVTVGLRLEEKDWVGRFIEQYKSLLPTEAFENAYSFNLASFYYSTSQFDKVLSLLLKVEYTDLRYSLGAKALLLRTYYELDAYDAFLSLSDAFQQYIKRNKKMSDHRKQGFYNLLKYAKRIVQIKTELPYQSKNKSQKELKKLSTEIEQEANIINKAWLKEKVFKIKKLL
ncbi:MAG TPA: hypothetical protein ENK52_06670 [Saprospiraceae bacterium]|nr:hypothetical protein [Saprospiraceae bacterium]